MGRQAETAPGRIDKPTGDSPAERSAHAPKKTISYQYQSEGQLVG
jgi:hypothetical protein